jgi:polysaccharide export outer membrane protein
MKKYCSGTAALILMMISLASIGVAQTTVPAGRSSETITTAQPAGGASDAQFQERTPRYRLRKGDTFDVEFAFSPEFNQTIPVQPDGFITLKGVGTIFVFGQTLPELTETIKNAYAKTLHEPVITVALKDFEKPYFIAAGEVGKPGKYDLRSDLTLTEAIAIAGGLTEKSKHSQVVLFRPASDGMMEARLLDVKKMLNTRDLKEDVHLRPGDMVFVPQNRMSKIQRYLPTSSMGAYLNPITY